MDFTVSVLLGTFILSIAALFVFIWSLSNGLFGDGLQAATEIFVPNELGRVEDPAATAAQIERLQQPAILGLRIDESLYFANARFLEDAISSHVAVRSGLRHVVLQCSAINDIDASALESLETINQRLKTSGVQLHLSEVKGPVLDRLQRSHFLGQLSGRVFLTHHQAVMALA